MFTYLFFDDQKLYCRRGLERRNVKPELLKETVYTDGISDTCFRAAWVFKTDDGRYRMIYQGRDKSNSKKDYCFIAVSDDGLHFCPEDVSAKSGLKAPVAPNELFPVDSGEIADITEDNLNNPAERYKMLFCDVDGEGLRVHGTVFASSDLINWKKIEGEEWNAGGAEPITGVFYNKARECFTIMVRPDWGVRKVGYVDTTDWRSFTPYESCMQVDSLDDALCEMYGMPSFEYKGYYIGLPLLYRGFEDTNNAKFYGGTMEAGLAYSFDGHHWQRGLRTPFITGLDAQTEAVFGHKKKMVWPSFAFKCENGDILLYSSFTKDEHGIAFEKTDGAAIAAFKITADRLVELTTKSGAEGVLSTRENIWNSGEAHINLSCKSATLAVYESTEYDLLGYAREIEGYSHDDCIPFSGDSTDWIPQFKSGKTLDELKGKTLIFELKIYDGSIYSISGDMTPVMNLQAARYRKFGTAPKVLL